VTNTISVEGTYYVGDNETYNNAVINLGSPAIGGDRVTIGSHDTTGGALTIGSTATINDDAGVVFVFLDGYTVVNHGHIDVAAGSGLFLDSSTVNASDTVIGAGTVSIASGGDLGIAVDLNLDGTSFAPEGTGTISFGYGVTEGTIANGTLAPGSVTFIPGAGAVLDNLTYKGAMNVGNDGGLQIMGELQGESAQGAGPGTINVEADGAIFADDKATINNFVINVGPTVGPTGVYYDSALFSEGSVTLGSATTLNSTGSLVHLPGALGEVGLFGQSFVSQGHIDVAVGTELFIAPNYFTNTGTVLVATDGTLTLGYGPSDITNAGTIEVADGGTLIVHGMLSETGNGKLIIDPGGTFEYNGVVENAANINSPSTLEQATPTLTGGAITLDSDNGTGSDITVYQKSAISSASVGDFSMMHFIRPAGNDGNSGSAHLAHDAFFADSFKAALVGVKESPIDPPRAATGSGGIFADTFGSAGWLHAVISQRDFTASLPSHSL